MATTIVTKNNATAGVVPSAGQLVQGELAVNVADKRLYTLDGTGQVVLISSGSDYIVPITIIVNSATTAVTVTQTGSGGAAVFNNSGSGNAVRITNTGSGNSLLVEDSTNPDSTPFVVNADGRVMSGLTSPLRTANDNGDVEAAFSVAGQTVSSFAALGANTTTARFAPSLTLKRQRGAAGAGTIVVSADTVGRLDFQGYDGTAFIDLATIQAAVDGTPGTNDMPGRLVFSTTADGASTPTERMRIDSVGDVGIGTTNPTARLNVVDATTQDAVRITQTGTGNALVVEDSANPDSSPFVIDASGRIIEGYTTTTTVLDPGGVSRTPNIQIHGLNTSTAGQSINNWATSGSSYPVLYLSKSKSGVVGTQGVVASGDTLGDIQFSGDDGTNFVPAARIFAAVDGTPGTNDMPGRLVFSTTADGAATPTERLRIDSSGNMLVGGTAARGTTVGSAHLDLFNGTAPAGTLTNGISLYSASGDFSFMDSAGNGYRVGYRNVPPAGTKTGSYTLALADVGEYIQVGTGGSITIPDATFSEGDAVSIFNNTSGNITITCTITTAYISGIDTDRATMTLSTRGIATILFISGTVCVVTGNVS